MSRKKKRKEPPPKLRDYPHYSSLREAEPGPDVYAVFLDGAGFQFAFKAPSDDEAVEYLREQYRDNEEEEVLRGFRLMKLQDVARWGMNSGLRVV